MIFSLNQKVKFLNDLVCGSLVFTHYDEWEMSSYGSNTLFSQRGPIGYVRGKDFRKCVNRAFKLAGRV